LAICFFNRPKKQHEPSITGGFSSSGRVGDELSRGTIDC
jgi:hypothetical protein